MNLFPKTVPWVVVSLIAASSAFGKDNQCCSPDAQKCCGLDQSQGMDCPPLKAGYNAPARIDVKRCWDIYADCSFIYWQPEQEDMALGVSNTQLLPDIEFNGIRGNLIDENFQYKPGFKVGIGMNFAYDEWDAYTEYTWLHGTNTTSSNGPGTPGGNILSLWGSPVHGLNTFTSAEGTWRFKFDFLDGELSRSYYVGKRLSLYPYFGLRGAWIRQKHIAHYINTDSSDNANGVSNWTIKNQSVSWGIGPRAGIGANWMLGRGFRIYGDSAADILYTHYDVKVREADTLDTAWAQNITQSDTGYLRTHLDLELGIGWGSYFHCDRWHVDLSAGYGFQAFFNQNMFRHFNAGEVGYSFSPNGNLYIQGLTAMMRIDY
ncbi:MAG TPA: Lpg1974 family pore-forming outer membrane protein [Chlamydiales bacterium]|nr:Lpg1974 family pore-forming outer membrane protein [Chlamydiales bacterium]